MFACIVAGCLVQTEYEQLNESTIIFRLESQNKSIQTVCVFLTGSSPFPEGYGGIIYFSWPLKDQNWTPTGYLTNEKPSAFFSVKHDGNKSDINITSPFNDYVDSLSTKQAMVGIQLVPLEEIKNRFNSTNESLTKLTQMEQFCLKIAQNLYVYTQSFSKSICDISGNYVTVVPLSSIDKWYEMIIQKLKHNPNFWKE